MFGGSGQGFLKVELLHHVESETNREERQGRQVERFFSLASPVIC
jgi:hypothetical protein